VGGHCRKQSPPPFILDPLLGLSKLFTAIIDKFFYIVYHQIMIKGDIIRDLRGEGEYSQEFLAEELGISRPTYVAIEKGEKELTITQAQKLASIFGMSLNDLIAGKKPVVRVSLQKGDKKNTFLENKEIRISVPQKKIDKFKEILLYILEKAGSKPNIGITALYKLLYFIDFDYYEKFEEQLIGATYIKNHFGPTPIEFKKISDEMIVGGELEQVKSKYFQREQTKFIPIRKANVSILNGQEIKHVDEVLARLSDKNALELTEYSHKDVPWLTAKDGETLDYEAVFYRTTDTSVRDYGDDNL
jgi:DNA-binding XRE family transcriptional regulator/uncharacterized phage-associated protein